MKQMSDYICINTLGFAVNRTFPVGMPRPTINSDQFRIRTFVLLLDVMNNISCTAIITRSINLYIQRFKAFVLF